MDCVNVSVLRWVPPSVIFLFPPCVARCPLLVVFQCPECASILPWPTIAGADGQPGSTKRTTCRPDTFIVTGTGEYGEAEDDFAREDGFYDHALDAVQQATKLLKKNKIPIER